MAFSFHVQYFLEYLLLFRLFGFLVIHVAHLCGADQLLPLERLRPADYLSLLVVVPEEHLSFFEVELRLANLDLSRAVGVQLELLGHFQDHVLVVGVEIPNQGRVVSFGEIRIVGHRTVDELILSVLVTHDNLSSNLLFSINEAILVSMVVEVYLAPSLINLD